MARNITFKGSPIEVQGKELKAGQELPDFKVAGLDLSDRSVFGNDFVAGAEVAK